MASAIDICNVALGLLGDRGTIESLDPPEGSAQAEHCARFYPIARNAILEMHPWKFSIRRVALASLATEKWGWKYAYAPPSDAIKILAILPPVSDPDYPHQNVSENDQHPQKYEYETSNAGVPVILTDQESATARYVVTVTDTSLFSPLFVETLTWYLASKLAGPMLKGDTGAAESKKCLEMAVRFLAQASASDANQRSMRPDHIPTWIARR